MITTKSAQAVCVAVVGVLLAGAAGHAWSPETRSSLTFSGGVGLPGVTLEAGTYVFEVVNPTSGGNVITVRAKDRVCYMGFTYRVERPRGLRDDRPVMFAESKIGVAPPILAWYPTGQTFGYEFIYGSH